MSNMVDQLLLQAVDQSANEKYIFIKSKTIKSWKGLGCSRQRDASNNDPVGLGLDKPLQTD